MNNKFKSIIVFTILVVLTISGIVYNSSLDLGKDVYVVSPKENKEDDEREVNNNIKSKDNNNTDNDEIKNNETKYIKVYISGEVKTPGVISVSNDNRLIDAVDKLGGLTSDADLNRVNLALKIEDGNHYIIPKIGEEFNTGENSNQGIYNSNDTNSLEVTNNTGGSKININTASKDELDSLPGIGEVTAQKIIDYRNNNGKFSSIEDIKNVKGIGDNKFDDIKDNITT